MWLPALAGRSTPAALLRLKGGSYSGKSLEAEACGPGGCECALDTASKEFMNLLTSFGGPPLWELPIGDARAAVNGLSTQLCGPLADVHEVINRKISGPTGEFGIRLYTPKASREPLPIVLHYHGGGWALCNLDTHDAIARFYCKHAEAIVVSVDYRLAPEHKFPAAVDDSFAAFCWAVDHAGEFEATRSVWR